MAGISMELEKDEEAEGKNKDKEEAAATKQSAPVDMEMDVNETWDGYVSSDDEIDYSIKPEFYDPNLDDKDELWVRQQRRGQSSDAILSCPACFTTLCLDSQRHERYVTQYRAMFVFNCEIKMDETLLPQGTNRSRRSHGKNSDGCPKAQGDEMVFRPVHCAVCSAEVGIFDADQVYHFFNVIPSSS